MQPPAHDTQNVRIVLIGNGPQADEYRVRIAESGAKDFRAFKTRPADSELEHAHIVYVVDVPEKEAADIAAFCRAHNIIVNVKGSDGTRAGKTG